MFPFAGLLCAHGTSAIFQAPVRDMSSPSPWLWSSSRVFIVCSAASLDYQHESRSWTKLPLRPFVNNRKERTGAIKLASTSFSKSRRYLSSNGIPALSLCANAIASSCMSSVKKAVGRNVFATFQLILMSRSASVSHSGHQLTDSAIPTAASGST